MTSPPPDGTAEDPVIQELRSQITSLQNEVSDLRRRTDDDWLTEQRAEEIRGLVQDVLADADARASLLADGVSAGHDGKFFLASNDGTFRLNLEGHLQVRYIYNHREAGSSGIDENVAGFQVRRAKLKGSGHIGSPKIGFGFSLAGDRDDPTTQFEDYYAEYTFDNGMKARAGRFKQPFARVNLTSSSRQLAVERSLVNEIFNVDRSEGVMLTQKNDTFQWAVAYNDGIDGENTDFDENSVNFGVTGRIDFLLAGDWDAMKDFNAWSGQDTAAFLGLAAHYQQGEDGGATDGDDALLLTIDGSMETNGFGLFGAFYYADIMDKSAGADARNMGLELSASYMIDDKYEPFIRYEYIAFDDGIAGLEEDTVNVITLGMNFYQKKHHSKFTVDVVWVLDHIDDDQVGLTMNDPSTGLGLLDDASGEDGQLALRAQYQLTF